MDKLPMLLGIIVGTTVGYLIFLHFFSTRITDEAGKTVAVCFIRDGGELTYSK